MEQSQPAGEDGPGLREVPIRALVVDDSAPMRLTLTALLVDLGLAVTQVADGQRALEELAAAPYDLVFIDWYMPGLTGLETVRRIRADARFGHPRVVMVTSECEDHNIALALAAGVDEYVTKPFDRRVFENKLEFIGYGRNGSR